MLGADTFISAGMRLVVTVGILAAVYFLIVKPILHTTQDVVHQATRHSQVENQRAELSTARQQALGYASSVLAGSQPWPAAAREIRRCVADAGSSIAKMKRCANRSQAIVTQTLSPRNFAISYATSLDQQGETAQAAKVRSCVAAAGFRVGPMIRCRTLAGRYLFG